MGLFGGFKAKFSKDSVAKKNSKISKNTVVCVAYRVFSEFKDVPQYLPYQEPPVPKQPSPIKTVLPQSNPNKANGINSRSLLPSPERPAETMIITNPTARKSVNKLVPTAPNSRLSNLSVPQSDHLDVDNNDSTKISRLSVDMSKNFKVTEKPTPAVRSISYDKNSESEEEWRKTKSLVNDIHTADDIYTNSNEETTHIVKEPGKSIIKSTTAYNFDEAENIPVSKNNEVLLVDVTDDYSDQDYDEPLTQTITADESSLTESRAAFSLNTIEHSYDKQSEEDDEDNEYTWYQEAQSSQATSFQEEHIESKQTTTKRHFSSMHSFKTNSTLGATSNASNIFFASDDEEEEEEEPRPAPRQVNIKVNRDGVENRSSAEC